MRGLRMLGLSQREDLCLSYQTPHQMGIFFSFLVGLVASYLIGLSTQYYTSNKNNPVRFLAKVAQTGPATSIISGLSLGFISTLFPILR